MKQTLYVQGLQKVCMKLQDVKRLGGGLGEGREGKEREMVVGFSCLSLCMHNSKLLAYFTSNCG